jgi:hypothetical protein
LWSTLCRFGACTTGLIPCPRCSTFSRFLTEVSSKSNDPHAKFMGSPREHR